MTRIFSVAFNTFRELARSRILYLLLVFSLLLIAGSSLLVQLSIGQWSRIVLDVGLATVHLAGVLVAVMVGVGLIAGEVQRKTVYVVLAKPLPRWQFVVGRYLGLVAVLALLVAVMGASIAGVLVYVKEPVSSTLSQALFLVFMEQALVAAIAVLFSAFSTPTLATIFSLGLFLVGHTTGELAHFAKQSEGAMGMVLLGFSKVFPNLELLNIKSQAANLLPVEPAYVGTSAAYALLWSGALLVGASFIFARRDLR